MVPRPNADSGGRPIAGGLRKQKSEWNRASLALQYSVSRLLTNSDFHSYLAHAGREANLAHAEDVDLAFEEELGRVTRAPTVAKKEASR